MRLIVFRVQFCKEINIQVRLSQDTDLKQTDLQSFLQLINQLHNKLNKMGNNLSEIAPSIFNQPLYTQAGQFNRQYFEISDYKHDIVGVPKIVKSSRTGTELQEYFVSNYESNIETDQYYYDLRQSSLSHNVVVVFNSKLINQMEKKFQVRVEKMKGRLNQINGLSHLEALCLLEGALHGFAEIVFHAKGPFAITEKMIAINDSSYIRVWLNENFALNKIAHGTHVQNETVMINQVFSIILERVSREEQSKFGTTISQINRCQRLIDAKNVISCMLQNCNKKLVIQDLIKKQIAKYVRNLSVSSVDFNNQFRNSFDGRENKISMNEHFASSENLHKFIVMRPLSSHRVPTNYQSSPFKKILGQAINGQVLTANQTRESRLKSTDTRMFKDVWETKSNYHGRYFASQA